MRLLWMNSTSLYGPVPIAALPELKSSVVAFSATALGTMYTAARSLGSSTCGDAVLKMTVYGSTIFVSTMGFTNVAYDDGLLGTPGTRLYVATTSSAVNGEPSWNFTLRRSLNSQVRSSMARQEAASPGRNFMFASRRISGS